MRGQTEASETLGAQQLKSQYGSVRIRDRQRNIRMARDITRIAAEIMSENFAAKTLLDMSQLEIPTEARHGHQGGAAGAQLKQIETDLARAQADPRSGSSRRPIRTRPSRSWGRRSSSFSAAGTDAQLNRRRR